MDLNKKYQVFISSTYEDLKKARAKVTEKVLSIYHFPIGMEMFSADNEDQWTVIKRTIDISDYYVLIIGHRYGSISEEGISYTEKEFNYAQQKGVPILAFIRNRDAATIPSEREQDIVKQIKLDNFILKAQNSRMCDYWETEEELASKVSISLMKQFIYNPGVGWVRANNVRMASAKKLIHNEISLEQYIVNYLADKKREGLIETTLYGYQLELKLFLEFSKERNLLEMNTSFIKDYLRFREDNYEINSKNSLEVVRRKLKIFFDWLLEERVIDNNPVKKIKPYRFEVVDMDELNRDEINKLRAACQTPRERAFVEVLLSTGCYLSEILKITLNDIDWDYNTIKINGIKSRKRFVLLSLEAKDSLLKYLDVRKGDSIFLFVKERSPFNQISSRGMQREIEIIASRTNINKKITAKTFRHAFAKNMLEEGYPQNFVQALLGNNETRYNSAIDLRLTKENLLSLRKVRNK